MNNNNFKETLENISIVRYKYCNLKLSNLGIKIS